MLASLIVAAAVAVPSLPAPALPTLPGVAVAEDLVIERETRLTEGQGVRLQQRAHGIPVWRGSLTLRLDAAGQVVRTHDARKLVGPFDPRPRISARAAARIAADASEVPLRAGAVESAVSSLVVVPGARPRLAWQLRLRPLSRTDNPYTLVDAHSGAVLTQYNRVFHQDADLGAFFADSRDAKSDAVTTQELHNFPDVRDPSGHLVGTRVITFNCCPREGCAAVGGPKMTEGGFGTRTYYIAECDQLPVATNARTEGNYVYAPAPHPDEHTPVPGPADGDEFAEVNAFHHLNRAYDFVFRLDPAVVMPPSALPIAVLVNYLEADYDTCVQQIDGSTRCDGLARFDNAMFIPASATSGEESTDAIVLGQGARVDYGYDADVIIHEFGHAVVQAWGGLEGLVLDEWGAWASPGALNEGYADWFAAALSGDPVVGDYAGGTGEDGDSGGIRDLAGGYKCPADITGEVHDDSRPFSNAIWAIRQALTGLLLPDEIDRAIFDALRQLPTDASYDTAAIFTLEELKNRSPAARTVAENVFREYGVLECHRAWDLKPGTPIEYVQVFGRGSDPRLQAGEYAPGMVQFELDVPEGAVEATLTFEVFSRTQGQISVVYSADEPVRFRYDSGAVAENGTRILPTAAEPNRLVIPLAGRCKGETVYAALVNASTRSRTVANIGLTYRIDPVKVANCSLPPPTTGGNPDPVVTTPAAPPPQEDPAAKVAAVEPDGCGCAGAGAGGAWPLFAAALALVRLRRRRS